MSIIENILQKIDTRVASKGEIFPDHNPEMLLIGCVDARKDPVKDLGIPRGRAIIMRNVAALVKGTSVSALQRETEAATLELAVKVMKVKHIAVMGHTDCGGIRSLLLDDGLKELKNYLKPLDKVRDLVKKRTDNIVDQSRELEIEAVRISIRNLLSYDYIKEAVDRGDLEVHGWILDISNGDLNKV